MSQSNFAMFQVNSPLKNSKRRLLLLQKIAIFLSKTQGRDKLCKLLQYLFRFLAACYPIDSYRNTKYTSLSEATKQARKIFRLFKSINEYEGMTEILFNEEESLTNILKLLARACYFFYWAFDNVSILSKIKLFRMDYQKPYRIGYHFWFAALVFMNIGLLIQLYFDVDNRNNLKQPSIASNSKIHEKFSLIYENEKDKDKEESKELTEEEKTRRRKDRWLKLIKNSFDLIPSGKGSKILEIVFNRIIPQKFVGVCGFLSASISIYQIACEINQEF